MNDEAHSMPNEPFNDRLDELLRTAQWPDDASDPLDRLLRLAQWPEECSRQTPCAVYVRHLGKRTRRRMILAAVAATTAALFAAVAIWTTRSVGDKSAGVGKTVAGDVQRPPAQPSAANGSPKIVSAPLPPREVRLRMIFEQVRARSAAEDEAIDRIVDRRVAEPDGDLEKLVQPLIARRVETEQRLLGRFSRFVGEREPAAVELLGCLGSESSLPLLLHERLKPATHAAAIRALLKLADTRTLARLERQEWDDDLREEVTAALQSRDDEQMTASTLIFQGDQSCSDLRSDSWPCAALF